MRIAYVTETYPPELNGVALTAQRTIEYLRNRGHEVELIRPRQKGEAACDEEDKCLTPGCPIPLYPDLRLGFARTGALMERFQRHRPQLVHVATQGPLGWAAARAARRCGLAVTSDFRTNFHQYSRYYGLGLLGPAVYDYLRHFHNRTHRTFVPTRALRGELAKARFERLEVVGRGVETRLFSPDKRNEALRCTWAGKAAPVLLYVGRLAAEKNVTLALCAFEAVRRRLPDAQMVVVGDGPQRKKLQADFPAARFVGVQRGEALAQHYASADVFVFPSLSETFGNVTLEALASGLPVVAYDAAAASEYVEDCGSGLLVKPGEDLAFIAAVCSLAWQHRHFMAMRERARTSALKANWDAVLGKFETHLGEAVYACETSSAGAACAA